MPSMYPRGFKIDVRTPVFVALLFTVIYIHTHTHTHTRDLFRESHPRLLYVLTISNYLYVLESIILIFMGGRVFSMNIA